MRHPGGWSSAEGLTIGFRVERSRGSCRDTCPVEAALMMLGWIGWGAEGGKEREGSGG